MSTRRTEDLPVATLVLEHQAAARIFHKHRIDFCCRGEQTLAEACAARGLSVRALVEELDLPAEPGDERDLRALSTPEVIDRIVEHHHAYLREALPFVRAMAAKVARVHGDTNANLPRLDAIVRELADTLEPHLEDEEQRLFPALRANQRGLAEQLAAMRSEHEQVGALLERARTAAEDYRVPEWACRSYRALFAELEQLEYDTLRHVHLENHLLAPRFLPEPAGR